MADAGCLCFWSTAPCMTDMIVHWASRMAGILPQHHNGCYWALPAPPSIISAAGRQAARVHSVRPAWP